MLIDITLFDSVGSGSFIINDFSKKEFGGSAILDIGIYLLQLSQYVFKEEPKNVTSVGIRGETDVDISETVILEYSDGKRAVLNVEATLNLYNKATIYGTKGRYTVSVSCSLTLICLLSYQVTK